MLSFTKRNILLYFRDKTTVFFSLFAALIIIVLYVVFLGDLTAQGMPDVENKTAILYAWLLAGILAVTSMTTTLGAFGIFVEDRAHKRIMDFYASPIDRSMLVSGYILSALFVGVLMSVITFIFSYIYLVLFAEVTMTLFQILLVLGTIILSVLASASTVLFLVSFLHTSNAFAATSMVIGTLIGFLAGIYIPIGQFPAYIQTVIKIFPLSHSASLLRQILMDEALNSAFLHAPSDVESAFLLELGIRYEFSEQMISNVMSVGYLVLTTIVFFALAVLQIRKNK